MINITVEELEIIVEASIQPAIEEFKKAIPQIKKQMSQIVDTVEKTMSQTNFKGISSKINQAVQTIKKRIDNLKKSSKNNEIAIKVNNSDAQKQISQVEKEIESLQKKISARQMKLDVINPQIDQIVSNTRDEVVPEGIDKNSPVMDSVINNALASNKDFTSLNSQAQKLYTEIELYNRQLDEAKAKMAQLKQEIGQAATTQNKLSSFFNAFKGKIDQAKVSIGGMKNNFSQIPKITQKITNNIKQMGKGMKQGLGHVLRYAGALFSLQTIYSTLSGAANSWLSSQNAQAKLLSANIEYMKYAMRKCFCTSY